MGHIVNAVQIDIHNALPILRSNIGKQLYLRYPRIIYQHVYPAVVLQNLFRRRLAGSVIRDVAAHRRAAQLSAEPLSLVRPGIIGEHHVVRRREFCSDGASDGAGSAGN